ncbi:MAG: sugar ABC transporter ATP-binding protein [Acidimicrobiales bacterium]|jgi:rhamnose transport system ATP-binding protein
MTAGGTAPGDATGSYHGAVHQREGEPSADDVQPAALEEASGLDLGAPVLVLEHATKSFGAVHALVDGDIELRPGETHGLVGENGAGKSTLVKVLAGVHRPDSGRLVVNGREMMLDGPAASRAVGIAVIHQEASVFPDLSVAENVFIGREPLRGGRRIDFKTMNEEIAVIVDRLGVRLDPRRIAKGLSVADQQIMEIAKALSLNASIIVMDEPTASLSAHEVDRLFEMIELLRRDGTAVLFISHRLHEVFDICQRVTVMRDGSHVFTRPLAGLVADDLVQAMVGREVVDRPAAGGQQIGDVVLAVERLSREGVFSDVSFDVHAGEIVVLAGLVGSGRSEVARAIFGIDRRDAGGVLINGRPLRSGSPTDAIAAGVGFVPEDRRQQGLVMAMAIDRNISLASYDHLKRRGFIWGALERSFATDWASRLRLKYGRLSGNASTLSGGNQQKLVLAKWLGRNPSLLIVDEPTRGIDVATKAEVHRLLERLAAEEGVAVLMISSELPEVLRMGNRTLVMREGRLVAQFSHSEASEERIVAAATGQTELASDLVTTDAVGHGTP